MSEKLTFGQAVALDVLGPDTTQAGAFVERAMELANALADAGIGGWSTPERVVAEKTAAAEAELRAHLESHATHQAAVMEAAEGMAGVLTGAKHVLELAVASKDGRQYTYLETRVGSFLEVTGTLVSIETALAAYQAVKEKQQ